MSAVYHPLATSDFAQDWTTTSLIAADDNWADVPSLQGFRGDELTTATATDPQGIVGAGTQVLDVNANKPDPNAFATGGVAEFELADPVVALSGSGTADAPHLVIYLDASGRENVQVSYTLRDIDGTTDNAVQPVALQYRIGNSGDFVNVPAAFVADASTGPSLAEATFAVTATLPVAVNGQAEVQVRIITNNAVGNDEWIGVDDIRVTSAAEGVLEEPAPGTPGTVQTFTPNAGTTEGSSDASTAIALDAHWMVVADDEANVLRVYPRGGGDAVLEWSYESNGPLLASGELDLEGGTRIGDTLYFIGSHSNSKGGAEANNREFIFAVDVSGSGATTQFAHVGTYAGLEGALAAWDAGNVHGLGSGTFGLATSAGAGIVPEGVNGFSIEGLAATADGSQLLLAFRAPQSDAGTRSDALIVPVSTSGLFEGTATFGTPFELDLGGRGIRSIERSPGGDFLIVAGPAGGASTEATHDFRLFRWDGASQSATELDVDLDTLLQSTGGSFESIVDVRSTTQGTLVQLLQDNGDTLWAGQTQVSKDLAPALQQFQGNWVEIGADVSDTTAPQLVATHPADGAPAVAAGADLVLRFDEGVQAASGNFVIRRASDGSEVETIAVNSANVTVSYNTVTINPSAPLDASSAYYVEADAGVVVDHAGHAWAGLSGASAFDFTTAAPPTVLQAGDVLFMGANADSTDAFAFVLMADIAPGTQIGFTDRDYTSAGGMPASGEAAYLWTADVAYTAGTIVTIQPDQSGNPVADKGAAQGKGGGQSATAETLHAFQGSIAGLADAAAGAITVDRFLASINFGGAAAGEIPADVTAAGAAFSFAADNVLYTGSLDRSDLAVFESRLQDPANWSARDDAAWPLSGNSLYPTVLTTKISAVQGSGAASQMAGSVVSIEGIVTAYMPGMKGFYVQEEAADSDDNAATSEAIFVYFGNMPPEGISAASVGDVIRVTGTVAEFNGLTELTGLSGFQVVTDNAGTEALPAPVGVTLPVADMVNWEALEGMRVTVSSATEGGELVVTDNYNLGRYGQVTLTSDDLIHQYTETYAPDVAGYTAWQAEVQRDQIVLDDGSSRQNPDPLILGRGGDPLSAANTLRAGDAVASITGIVDQFVDGTELGYQTTYRVQATQAVEFAGDARPTAADLPAAITGAEIKVASVNMLNYFTDLGTAKFATPNGTEHEPRGASNLEEFTRQQDKIVANLLGLDADIVGLMEIQNNGFADGTSALDALVDALNAVAGPGTYAYIAGPFADGNGDPAVTAGDDAIMVGLLYKPGALTPVGAAAVPDVTNPAYDAFTASQGSRVPVAQTFQSVADGEMLTVVVNHFKSKGSVIDPDMGDGQGANNLARMEAAQDLLAWLATDPTGSADPDVLLVGDFNAYAMEDPLAALAAGGFGRISEGLSYSFDGLWGSLDHALASDSLAGQVAGATKWAINAEEPTVLDYNTDFKSDAQDDLFYAGDAYRSSDHNPILIGLNLATGRSVDGGTSADSIQGGDGNDSLVGGDGRDTMVGTAGDDSYWVDDRRDRTVEVEGEGVDTVYSTVSLTLADHVENLILTGSATRASGNEADNAIGGNALRNRLAGDAGNDTLDGGAGDDALRGEAGDDLLLGGLGGDKIRGGAGDDTLVGGEGDDRLSGDSGADRFFFADGSGRDSIQRFSVEDRIVLAAGLNGSTITDAASALDHAYASGRSVVIDLGAGHTVTLTGVQLASLTEGNFEVVQLPAG